MRSLLSNNRFYILVFSLLLSVGIFYWITLTIPPGNVQLARLVQIYGFTAFAYLYVTLLAGPLCYTFKSLRYAKQYLHARRALGVATFYFAFLHSGLSFFGQLGGFVGISFLSESYLWDLGASFFSLVILFVLAATSFDFVIKKMTFPKWKLLHRLVYFAGLLILAHMLFIGTHFRHISELIPQTIYVAVFFLLLLEAPRFDTYLYRVIHPQKFSVSLVLMAVLLVIFYFTNML